MVLCQSPGGADSGHPSRICKGWLVTVLWQLQPSLPQYPSYNARQAGETLQHVYPLRCWLQWEMGSALASFVTTIYTLLLPRPLG